MIGEQTNRHSSRLISGNVQGWDEPGQKRATIDQNPSLKMKAIGAFWAVITIILAFPNKSSAPKCQGCPFLSGKNVAVTGITANEFHFL